MRRRSGDLAERQRTDERPSAKGAATKTVRTARAARLVPALGTAVAVLTLTALAPAPIAAAPPTVTPGSDVVRVAGLPAGGRAVVLGVVREMRGAIPGQARWQGLLEDADGDGTEIFGFDGRWADRAVWLAVDLGSGEWAVEPAGSEAALLPAAPLAAPAASAAEWTLPAGYRELLWVRSGDSPGAWGAALGDGGESDADGAVDGQVRVVAGLLEPVAGGAAAPAAFAAGDLVFLVDPDSLAVEVLTVGAAATGVAAPGDGEAVAGEVSR